jgi:hypothetical protein
MTTMLGLATVAQQRIKKLHTKSTKKVPHIGGDGAETDVLLGTHTCAPRTEFPGRSTAVFWNDMPLPVQRWRRVRHPHFNSPTTSNQQQNPTWLDLKEISQAPTTTAEKRPPPSPMSGHGAAPSEAAERPQSVYTASSGAKYAVQSLSSRNNLHSPSLR